MGILKRIFLALFSRVVIYSRLFVSSLICIFCNVRKGRVVFWSTMGKDYSCNPLYISNYLLDHEYDTFEIYWIYRKNLDKTVFDARIIPVKYGSFKHLYIIQTAEFLVTNHRTSVQGMFWIKRPSQKYIMTWHGSMALKRIEKDAIESLGCAYERFAKKDSAHCSLMLSDSDWFTQLLRKSFWYEGEILQVGMPRNDILYCKDKHSDIRTQVSRALNIPNPSDKLIVLYAPTFRTNHGTSEYILCWEHIKAAIEPFFNKEVIVLMRLHPTLLGIINTDELISEDFVINASGYNNIQELLIASDILITDYSSTMFEFSILRKPCFLYTPDAKSYDRGLYFPVEKLPFPYSFNQADLINDIITFDRVVYFKKVESFMNRTFNVKGNGHACENVAIWMKKHSK